MDCARAKGWATIGAVAAALALAPAALAQGPAPDPAPSAGGPQPDALPSSGSATEATTTPKPQPTPAAPTVSVPTAPAPSATPAPTAAAPPPTTPAAPRRTARASAAKKARAADRRARARARAHEKADARAPRRRDAARVQRPRNVTRRTERLRAVEDRQHVCCTLIRAGGDRCHGRLARLPQPRSPELHTAPLGRRKRRARFELDAGLVPQPSFGEGRESQL